MEKLPIIIDGTECGVVRFRREGAYMLCQGQARWRGDVLRLWVYGSGTPGYLGVLIPDGQGSGILRKKFSLADFSKLPHPLAYCSTEKTEIAVKEDSQKEEDILWYDMGDGTLIRTEGHRSFVAFPTDRIRLPRGAHFLLRIIEGREYVIFPR